MCCAGRGKNSPGSDPMRRRRWCLAFKSRHRRQNVRPPLKPGRRAGRIVFTNMAIGKSRVPVDPPSNPVADGSRRTFGHLAEEVSCVRIKIEVGLRGP